MATDSLTAAFLAKLRQMPFSGESLEKAKYGILDYIASAFAGRADAGVLKLLRAADEEGGRPLAPVLFHGRQVSREQSALINGFMGHALDYDDVHVEVRGHPSTVILPALIALADRGGDGRRFLEAYIVGVEAMARIALALSNEHYERGFHNTATAGVLAAAIAGAHFLGWPPEKTALALGLAATQAGGLRVHFGTETKPLHAGLAAAAAIRSLLLAEADVQASLASLDGRIGYFAVFGQGEERAREHLLRDDATPRIVRPGLWHKLYPFCSAAYFGWHAAEQLGRIPLDQIEEIEIAFTQRSDAALIHRRPTNGEEGRFSIEYIAALILSGRGIHAGDFQRVPVDDEIRAYMDRMRRTNVFDEPPGVRYTRITVRLAGGGTAVAVGDRPKGSADNPVTEAELLRKFDEVVTGPNAAAIRERILALDEARDVREFAGLLGLSVGE
jgi:2-methylcitrate dehydratase PrpD